jgi:hypothetical protein
MTAIEEQRAEAQRLATEFLAVRAATRLPWGGYHTQTAARLRELQHRSAVLFGESRGWTLSKSGFDYRTIARRGVHSGRHYVGLPPGCDHSWFYRLDRRAVAIATHPYAAAFEHKRSACEAFRARYGLGLAVLDWPSWYCPGASVFILWTAPEHPLTTADLERIEFYSEAPTAPTAL